MHRTLQVCLSVLLIFTLISGINLSAIAHHSKNPLKKARAKLCSIIRETSSGGSIGSIARNGIERAFKAVRGTITLIGNNNLSELEEIVYKGRDKKVPKRKTIRVKGFNNGKVINLNGLGKSGRGYTLSFSSPGSIFCVDPKRSHKTFTFPSVFNLSFGNSSIFLTEDDPGVELTISKSRVTAGGTFTSDEGSGEGRFSLKFTKK